MGRHALLSASSSKRWLNCTPSARLEEQFTGETGSVYADDLFDDIYGTGTIRLSRACGLKFQY